MANTAESALVLWIGFWSPRIIYWNKEKRGRSRCHVAILFLYENRVNIEISETRELFSHSRLPKKPECSRFILLSSEEYSSTTLGRFSRVDWVNRGSFPGRQNNTTPKNISAKPWFQFILTRLRSSKVGQRKAKKSKKNCIRKLCLRANERARDKRETFL